MRKPLRNVLHDISEEGLREQPQHWMPEPLDVSDGRAPQFDDPGFGRYAVGRDVMACLRRRKWLIASVAGLSMAALTALILKVPPTYEATSAVIYQGDRQTVARVDLGQQEATFGPDTLANEVEVLLSEELLTTVATKLDLVHNAEFNGNSGLHLLPRIRSVASDAAGALPPWGQGMLARLQGAPEPEAAAGADVAKPPVDAAQQTLVETVAALRGKLTIGPVGTSRVIRIGAQSHDPKLAALIANTMASAYTETLSAVTATSTREAHHWIEERLDDLRNRASKSAMAYETLRHDSGMTRGKDSTISQEQITQVSTELTQARQRRAEADEILVQANSASGADLDQLATATGSQLLAKLRELLAQATAKKADLESSGGLNLPNVVAVRAQVADLTRSINAERDRVRRTLQSRAIIARANETRLSATLEDLKSKIGESENSAAEMQALERDAAADRELYTSFVNRARQTDPDVNYQSPTARVLSRATVPIDARSPNKRLLLPVAFVLSLIMGTVAAVAKDSRRKGLRSMRDVQETVGQVSLGMLPLVRRGDRSLIRVFDEAVAQLLARIMLPARGQVPASVLITSAMPGEGKTNTAIAMASAATARGLKVLLIDADLRRRSLSNLAGMAQNNPSLVQLLRGEARLTEAAMRHKEWGFDVMPAGTTSESPMRLLATGAWATVLREIGLAYDLAIIDTPPVLVAGDTWLLSGPCDRTVMVSRWGSTPLATIELALDQLASARARVAGIVLTMVSHREHARYGAEDSIIFSPKLMEYHSRPRQLL